MNTKTFIEKQVEEIKKTVGGGRAISALSGGVDSSACTVLAHRALGSQLKVIFIDDGLMRRDEPQDVRKIFAKLGIDVGIVDLEDEFFAALAGQDRPRGEAEGLPLHLLQGLRPGGRQEQGQIPRPGHHRRRHHRDQGRGQDPAQHPRADRHRPREGIRLQGRRAAEGALQARRPQGRRGAGASRDDLQAHAVPGSGPGHPGHRRGDARARRHRPHGDRHRRGGDRRRSSPSRPSPS